MTESIAKIAKIAKIENHETQRLGAIRVEGAASRPDTAT
jgi:hypothetical protein